MKRTIICSAVTATVLGLTGCNTVDTGSSSTTSPSTTSSPTTATSTTATSTAPSSAAGATKISYAWPDATWTIEDSAEDNCVDAPGGSTTPYRSMFATKSGEFGCGGGGFEMPVCKRSADVVTCVTNYDDKMAARFTTMSAVTSFPATPDPMPLAVKLANGDTCTYVRNDMTSHYQGRHSWLWCRHGAVSTPSAILTLGDDGYRYFHKSSPTWTVDYDVGTNPPVSMNVTEVVYAG